MKTAMQELWDVLNDAEQNGVHEIGTQNFKRYIEGIYLEKEKQQIIDAYHINPENSIYLNTGIKYYDSNFGDYPEAGI